MKYIFRGHIVFEYLPEERRVVQHLVHEVIPAFDYCRMIPEDYKLLGNFFHNAWRHAEGKDVELKDIYVN